MGWETSTRTMPPGWSALRMRRLRIDGYRCQARDSLGNLCGAPANQVDHKIPDHKGGTDDLDNLESLCRWHHDRKSSAEGHEAQAARPRPRRAREPEPHPGLL